MEMNLNCEKADFVEKVGELFKGSLLENMIDGEVILRENEGKKSIHSLYAQLLQVKGQIEFYEKEWQIGDVLVTKEEKNLMIAYIDEANRKYQLIDLSNGMSIASFNSINAIKENFNYSLFDLIGNFNPKIIQLKRI